jgi:dCTP diphosphatase
VTSMHDADTTLAHLRKLAREFRDRREWGRFHTPKDLTMAIAVEAAELMEHLQWLTQDEAWELVEDSG